ncbi:MBL fold metallo-hydrolase [Vibrio parahaemolyticus]|uniref:MBL fold metallo-hydrolase n=1 Tax=Vibrio TaxID=662 RepID=UPI001A8C41C8|nr:MBL fold metallo-hydrolase [Vibrio parahaemolyticus]MBO0150739.1 MBL fold metallo-hydrolase [Vibrio parahaemolyticus]MBO0182556.1 MBL fold metallo-hydrolase [Vibrio parahaemolyticus]MBO0191448.1 MBL fold metallo-hydrolase [Vibrio parahaemolyticus]MDF4574915.1 MBL fold metallo-hydrolase [Vibrio parahaemolyticus]MDF5167587.1 MBL fold metallo-hydrolase [Vibrio parahaemolyticus]
MKIHHLRSATFIIESGEKFILIDPMLGKKGSMPPFSVIKAKATKNPTVEMPSNADELLNKVTHTLITHSQTFGIKALQHGDHLDPAGEAFLTERNIPVATPAKDKAYLKKYGLTVKWGIEDWQTIDFLGGKLTAVPALHGHGWIHKVMANGVGFFLELPNEPSIYISGDTVLTDDVRRALNELKPDITVVAAGRARMDVGQPLLMSIDEVMEFVRLSPNKVIANHMEALNHCAVTRPILKEAIGKNGLSDKVLIPADGETLEF